MSSVFIIGDKSVIKSKNALKKIKEKVKNEKEIDPSNYLNEGYSFHIKKNKNKEKIFDYYIEIMTIKEKNKLDKRLELKNRIKHMKDNRSLLMTEKINSMKRSVPKNIFNKYMNLMKKYKLNLPSPDEILQNPDKFKEQISMIAGTMNKVSNDGNANNDIKGYFKSLADLLNIEPMSINIKPEDNLKQLSNNSDTEDEDEYEIVPNLVDTSN